MAKLTDYRPQRANANKHTQRGLGMLEKSIQQDGWIGAITVAADGETFDGSARIETGATAGFEDAIVVRSDGSRPIVHIREDIPNADDPRAKRLGVAANRIASVDLSYDVDVLGELNDEGLLDGLFFPDELDALLASVGVPVPGEHVEPKLASDCFVEIYCNGDDLEAFRVTLVEWGKRKSVTINIS